ncbi:Gene Transfer Agent tail tape measure [hydrothermal vent metagenome]|uniref:Gene Transfer Agent tail tape measure n=1 Tax=hydrothermal vent metagenome TaxID=652676 RepID=A0A3B0S1J9_9ZZZZ
MNNNETSGQNPFAEAGQQLQELAQGPAQQAADQLEQMFSRAGNSIGRELERAARTGSVSFSKMAQSILRDLARITVKQVVGGALSNILGQAVSGGFAGARADGGPVLSGGAYLVGERGPEVFRPASSGSIETQISSAPITVNFNLGPGAGVEEFKRSQGQISAMLRRAVEQGRQPL